MALWEESETLKLLELWSEESVQALLEGSARSKNVYDKLASDLSRYGYTRTGVQCRERIKKLKKDYKKTKDNLNLTGNKRKQCKFFDELNDILGDRPSTKPATVIDTLAAASPRDDCLDNDGTQDTNASNDTSMTESVPDSSSLQDKPDNTVVKTKDSASKKTKDSTSKETDAVEEEETKEQKVAAKLEQDKKRKKRQTREERLEKSMNTVIDKVMKRQEECDQKFMELECKRMKLEERMLELESERRKEDREF